MARRKTKTEARAELEKLAADGIQLDEQKESIELVGIIGSEEIIISAVEETVAPEVITTKDADVIEENQKNGVMNSDIQPEEKVVGIYENYVLTVPQKVADIINIPGWQHDNFIVAEDIIDYIATVKFWYWRGHSNVQIQIK